MHTDNPLKHILYADDEPDMRLLVKMALENRGGIRTTLCGSGAEVCESAHRDRPQMIILDVMMAGMDGPSVLRHIRNDPRLAAIPVIFLTARTEPDEIESLKQMEPAGIVSKPFNPLTLANQIRELWKSPEKDAGCAGAALEESGEKLHAAFLNQLKGGIGIIDDILVRCKTGPLPQNEIERALHLAHNLAGSGTIFGFPEVSKIGRKADVLILKIFKAMQEGQILSDRDSPQLEKMLIELRRVCLDSLQRPKDSIP